nr:RNA-directed DNA polymerase, eukaryota, nucleotide-binding alpha-beta plait domain protein [Tanacetum cinerariifolium]
MTLHWSGVGAAPLMSPRQDETSEPLLYAGRMAGPYRCKDATRGRNNDPVTSGIKAVVDAYVPFKRSKAGKGFAFIRFIKVFNLERLIENLCTIWMGSFRLHVNKVLFEREQKPRAHSNDKRPGVFRAHVPAATKSGNNTGLWVLIELDSLDVIEKFRNHVGVGSWFSTIKSTCNSFVYDERIVWVSLEGLPIRAWTTNTFSKVAPKRGDLVVWEDSEENSLSCPTYPLGFTPDSENLNNGKDLDYVKVSPNDRVMFIPTKKRFTCRNVDSSSQRSTSMLISGGSILDVMDDLVKVE